MEKEQAVHALKVANDVVTHFGLLDLIFLTVLLIGLLHGYRKGFAGIFGKLFRLMCVVTVTLEYFHPIANLVNIKSEVWLYLYHLVVFLSLTIVSFFAAKLIVDLLGKIINIQFTDLLDKLCGAFTGAAFYILLLSFLSYMILLIPNQWLHDTFEKNNLSGPFLMQTAGEVQGLMRFCIPEPIRGERYNVMEKREEKSH